MIRGRGDIEGVRRRKRRTLMVLFLARKMEARWKVKATTLFGFLDVLYLFNMLGFFAAKVESWATASC